MYIHVLRALEIKMLDKKHLFQMTWLKYANCTGHFSYIYILFLELICN